MATGDLTTLASVREFLRISDSSQTDMDANLESLITSASYAIKRYTGRQFSDAGTPASAKVFDYYGGGFLHFAPYDLQTLTSVQIDTDGDTPTTLTQDDDFFLKPVDKRDGAWEGMQLRGLSPSVRTTQDYRPSREVTVTGVWGMPSVPTEVALATKMLVGWWYRQFSAPPGNELRGEGDRFGPVAWPTAVLQLLAPYRVAAVGIGG